MRIPMTASHFYDVAEVKRVPVIRRRLPVKQLSCLRYKTDGIGMPVLIRIHGGKAAGNAHICVSLFMQFAVDGLLAQELVHTVIGIVITYQEGLPDILW